MKISKDMSSLRVDRPVHKWPIVLQSMRYVYLLKHKYLRKVNSPTVQLSSIPSHVEESRAVHDGSRPPFCLCKFHIMFFGFRTLILNPFGTEGFREFFSERAKDSSVLNRNNVP